MGLWGCGNPLDLVELRAVDSGAFAVGSEMHFAVVDRCTAETNNFCDADTVSSVRVTSDEFDVLSITGVGTSRATITVIALGPADEFCVEGELFEDCVSTTVREIDKIELSVEQCSRGVVVPNAEFEVAFEARGDGILLNTPNFTPSIDPGAFEVRGPLSFRAPPSPGLATLTVTKTGDETTLDVVDPIQIGYRLNPRHQGFGAVSFTPSSETGALPCLPPATAVAITPDVCTLSSTDPPRIDRIAGGACEVEFQAPGAAVETLSYEPQRLFISTEIFEGNLGGLAGADAKCQASAVAAGRGGNWRALLSDETIAASTRLTFFDDVYDFAEQELLRPTSSTDWPFLPDGALVHVTASAVTLDDPQAWSGTRLDGTATTFACEDWSSSSLIKFGTVGSGEAGVQWLEDFDGSCASPHRLYCLEQN